MPAFIDLTDSQFGRLTVLSVSGKNKFNQICWRCKCSCGNTVEVIGTRLNRGRTLSCGCLHKDVVIERNIKRGVSGGRSRTKLHEVYKGIKSRVDNPKHKSYKDYGGRGVTICPAWRDSFLAFEKWAIENGYKAGLTIDRIDVNGNYSPENCRWVTMEVQANNKRNNHFIEYGGKTQTLNQWSKEVGIHHYTILDRLRSGWSVADALFIKPAGRAPAYKEVNA